MTKQRAPLTVENALFRVLGAIGVDRAAEITNREASYLRSLSDPDSRYRLTVDDAITLDLEHQAVTGEGTPIYETYGLLLGSAYAQRFADQAALARHAAAAIKECGEANAAIVTASLPGATARDRLNAIRETEEAIGHMTHALPLLQSSVRDGSSFGPQAADRHSAEPAADGQPRAPP